MPPALELLGPRARELVAPLLATSGEGRAIAWDADGTLWRGDVGEELLRYLSAERRLPMRPDPRGLYEEYERRVQVDPADAYAFSVEVMEGWPAAELELLCADFFARRFRGRVFAFASALLAAFGRAGYAPWIVSASPVWIVAAGAAALGVPRERVIAVDCALDGGKLTRRIARPVPCGEGKVAQLQARGVRPVLAIGNGELDLPMLAYAERALVIAPPGEDNALVQAAFQRGWPVQRA